jgi:murein DD-endopeptidase MepM/ murein hydrolase activator NlpD
MSRPHLDRTRVLSVAVLLLGVLASLAGLTGAVAGPTDPAPAGVWPLQPTPTVVEGFDPPGSLWGAGHRGVDLAGAVGQVVHTALAGTITFAGELAGRGVVVVDHGATRTTYEPVASQVRVGDVVARGQPIGTLELAGSHCFPQVCLHWGWLRGTTYLDPLLLVGGGPIVLLPLGDSEVSSPAAVIRRASGVAAGSPLVGVRRHADHGSPARREPTGPVWQRPLAMRPLIL